MRVPVDVAVPQICMQSQRHRRRGGWPFRSNLPGRSGRRCRSRRCLRGFFCWAELARDSLRSCSPAACGVRILKTRARRMSALKGAGQGPPGAQCDATIIVNPSLACVAARYAKMTPKERVVFRRKYIRYAGGGLFATCIGLTGLYITNLEHVSISNRS